jgi:hypothetical protein
MLFNWFQLFSSEFFFSRKKWPICKDVSVDGFSYFSLIRDFYFLTRIIPDICSNRQSPQITDDDLVSMKNMILIKSLILHLYNYAKKKFWNLFFNLVVEIYLPTVN